MSVVHPDQPIKFKILCESRWMKFIIMDSENFLISYTKPLNSQMFENSYRVAPKFHVCACIIQHLILGKVRVVCTFCKIQFCAFLIFKLQLSRSECMFLDRSQQAVRQSTLYESNMVSFCRNIPENFKKLSKGIHFIVG